jgi:hypothetical protein
MFFAMEEIYFSHLFLSWSSDYISPPYGKTPLLAGIKTISHLERD